MIKGDFFSVSRFEVKRLRRWDYLAVGAGFLVLVWGAAVFGGPDVFGRFLESAGCSIMVGLGLGVWRRGLWMPSVIGFLWRGLVLSCFWGVAAAGAVDWGLGSLALFWVFYLIGVGHGIVFSARGDGSLRQDDGAPLAVGLGGFERGKFYFLHIRDSRERERFLRFFESRGAVVVRKVDTEILDEGVTLKVWIEYLSGLWGARLVALLADLRELGIGARMLRRRLDCLSRESLVLAYLGVMFNRGGEMVVLDDVLADCGGECRGRFKEFLKGRLPDAVFIYIGSRMYEAAHPREFCSMGKARFIAVDPEKIVL
jgi:hypothetical protein